MFKKAYAKLVGSTTALVTVLSAAQAAFAGTTAESLITSSPFGFSSISAAIAGVMQLVFFFSLMLVLIYLVWGGIQWITAGGDKAGLEAARGKITGAIVGLIVVAVAFAIYNLLLRFVPGASTISI
ncbi:MAG: hypothetical protein KatS3mg087_0231 [Patescibacteria group bacterium]|jgi:uncharacterized membrane protein YtjA (UPF0391 family)|nr:MAG: hypothetical protein KatS3mg087_0231 [Patescibacteria group bacterium]